MILTVTQDDVDQAKEARKNGGYITETCPTAIALRRVTGKKYTVGFSLAYVSGEIGEFWLGESLIKQVGDFTSNSEFEPGDYELTPV